MQGRSIIDPVAEEANRSPASLERVQYPQLLCWVHAAKQIRGLEPPRQRQLGQRIKRVTIEGVADLKVQGPADMPSDRFAVAGEDL